ncbi:MAG: glutathione S-transferase family protein [Sphingomonadaceae bacterium]|uniref:glutathione S-transferase family protein n=1 Tax=Thermaurantiacus sp. TaxID=2820283 RepID=UPI00298ED276|nr:glutathione S-transferase family protein [Thermaurantiacus sp.]MCS6987649.1 glutathione S-transferase family protein [Sphingomonadaceae bacterium]MDW8415250.1 glutathione S-transferase family protein [Thermaurantiacus sp.]
MKLWHCIGARSFRPLWMAAEMGLKLDLEVLPFPPRWRQPRYLEVNPLGTVPFFTDGPVALTESVAICHWLGVRYGPTPLMVGPDEPDFGDFLNLMYQADATLTFPQTLVLRYTRLEPEERRQPKVAADYARWFLGRTKWIERQLADGRPFLVAGRFTAADIAVGYAFLLAETLELMGEVAPVIHRWFEGLKTRDGFARARALEQAAEMSTG